MHAPAKKFSVLLACLGLRAVSPCAAAGPTLAGVHYGPHERHVLDFFKAESKTPAPVLIFFHGGGFTGGDKRSFHGRAPQYLAAGISVITANYRYSRQAVYPGPMLDGARVVQFVRSKAEVRKRALDASAIVHASKDDPPLFLTYTGKLTPTPLSPDTKFSGWIHHPRFGELLKQKYDSLGLECHFYHRDKPEPDGAQIEFLRKAFSKEASRRAP